MEQSASTINRSTFLTSATEDEIIVANVLLHLKTLVSLTESLANFNWGRRKRRSCLDEYLHPLPASTSRPPPVQATGIEIKEMRMRIGEKSAAAAAAASPTTPLSFSPSESDGKSKREKTYKKRARAEYLTAIEELTGSRNVLRAEVENVKKFYSKLKAYNSELKAMKQKMSARVNSGAVMAPHQQPYIYNPPVQQEFRCPIGPIRAEVSACDGPDRVGPLGIDLNFPAAEAFLAQDSLQPSDAWQAVADRRARFAEARRKRRGLLKAKSSKRLYSKKSPDDLKL